MPRFALLFLLAISCSPKNSETRPTDQPEEYNYPDDFKVYIEKRDSTDTDENRYTNDNYIYRIGRNFFFDYYILKEGDTLQISSPNVSAPGVDDQRDWKMIRKNEEGDRIETISIGVRQGISNESQTNVKYDYQKDGKNTGFNSMSGVIENKKNVWIHPHRDKYFMILEINPFPYIQQPYEVGHSWNWSLAIGDYWGDTRWKTWVGGIRMNCDYKIIARQVLETKIGPLDCWVVEGNAVSEVGKSALISFFNEDYGFVRLEYTNIDDSKLMIEVRSVEEPNF